ncbi:Lacal_2735 family protein [Candidatus Arcticimaribacter]|jgi:hypothetical protein|nr:Lacal_2735 family protein [Candidatus Arcticimaribacter sp.]MDA9638598.1 Lacal_2735 family protein [Candidatus Arcticimaribacter sp.]
MFGIFKKKTEVDKLQSKYKTLLKEAYDLSKINRSKSDQKTFEAEEVYKQIELLNKKINLT